MDKEEYIYSYIAHLLTDARGLHPLGPLPRWMVTRSHVVVWLRALEVFVRICQRCSLTVVRAFPKAVFTPALYGSFKLDFCLSLCSPGLRLQCVTETTILCIFMASSVTYSDTMMVFLLIFCNQTRLCHWRVRLSLLEMYCILRQAVIP